MIYLASPYSHPDPLVRKARYETVMKIAHDLQTSPGHEHHLVYSPIMHFHPMCLRYEMPSDAGYWWNLNKNSMDVSSKLIVACMSGWKDSAGVALELEYAKFINMPVTHHTVSENATEPRSFFGQNW